MVSVRVDHLLFKSTSFWTSLEYSTRKKQGQEKETWSRIECRNIRVVIRMETGRPELKMSIRMVTKCESKGIHWERQTHPVVLRTGYSGLDVDERACTKKFSFIRSPHTINVTEKESLKRPPNIPDYRGVGELKNG